MSDHLFLSKASQLLHPQLGIPLIRDAAGEMTVDTLRFIAAKLKAYRKAWVEHPQFEHLRTFLDYEYLPFDDPTWIPVVHVIKHPPGIGKRDFSYIVADIGDLPAVKWGTKRPHNIHHAIRPISLPFQFNPRRMELISYSYDGAARGFNCRMNLKSLLPTHLKKYVSKVRRMIKTPKYRYLRMDWEQFGYLVPRSNRKSLTEEGFEADDDAVEKIVFDRSKHPDWYKSRTKRDLWKMRLQLEEPELAAQFRYWLGDEHNFYDAATGRIHPEDVQALFIRQPATSNRHQAAQSLTLPMFDTPIGGQHD